jgi:hypothetical protein
MYDRNYSELEAPREFPLAAGAAVAEEGQLFAFVDDGAGGSALQPSTGGAGERLAGFATTDAFLHVTRSVVEAATVPAAAPFTVQLENVGLVGAAGTDILVYDETAAAALVFAAGAPAAGQFNVVYATGLLTFNVAEASNVLRIQYRYNLTQQEALTRYHDAGVHRFAQTFFGQLAVVGGHGLIWTNQYDTAVDWAVDDAVFAGAGGQLVNAGPGTAVGVVHEVPRAGTTDSDRPGMLGVRFEIQPA